MPAFGDIGKAAKDLLTGGFQYDQKVSIATKTESGVGFTASGKNESAKGISGDVNVNHKVVKGVTVEAKFTSATKLVSSVTIDDVAPGLKFVVSASIPDKDSGKLAFNFGKGCYGAKGEVGLRGTPKMDVSGAAAVNGYVLGGAISYDTAKSLITKYDVGVQYEAKDFTVAAVTADKLDTVKVSYLHKVNSDLSVGAELSRKNAKGQTSFNLGASQKLEGGALAKASLANTGIISLLYQQDLRKGTTGVLSTCFDTKNLDKSAKLGLELKVKA